MKKSAFTLIELLVVIAIIAVLAGIALPVFSSASERSRAVKDANNLRQIGIAFVAYTNDNSDSIFVSATSSWVQSLNPRYLQSWKIFQSPFDKRTASEDGKTSPISYAMNDNLYGSQTGKSMSDIVSPSVCVLMGALITNEPVTNTNAFTMLPADSPTSDGLTKAKNMGMGTDPKSTGGTHTNFRHINILFADSHVGDMTMSDFHDTTGIKNSDSSSPITDLRWNGK